MRVLDLGAHDGFIASWIGRQLKDGLPAEGLVIDGVELNSTGVRIAQERAARHGIAGTFHVGLAEDAPHLLEPASYDAVIAFELIEHVAEVDRFLASCEAMLKPGGRVYLSTPDGTFGAGQNPHHLRVYRVVDLAEVCRRRGTLEDLRSGPDGIAFASYTPWQAHDAHGRGEVAIWTGPAWKPWTPLDIESPGGLGGSETAATRLADSLHAAGYCVTVFGEVEPQGLYRQVAYRHHSTFDPTVPRKAVIGSRAPHLFDRPLQAESRIFWMHDTDYGDAITDEGGVNADFVVTLSRWHEAHVSSRYPSLGSLIRRSGNGIVPMYFVERQAQGADIQRVSRRVVYSSSPDRGLDFLLQIWPKVREKLPDAELAYCYADVYDHMSTSNPGLARFRQRVNELADQEGVVNMGALSQPDLALAMLSSGVWAAPSWHSQGGRRFYETYCIGAVEAAAAGCWRVMSNWGALEERTEGDGFWIGEPDAPPETPPNEEQWVNALVRAMEVAEESPPDTEAALETTWDRVAEDFIGMIESKRPALVG